jgi:hypothetical protein
MWDENGGDSWAYTNVLGTLIYGEKPAKPEPAAETVIETNAETAVQTAPEAAAVTDVSPQTADSVIIALFISALTSGAVIYFSKKI